MPPAAMAPPQAPPQIWTAAPSPRSLLRSLRMQPSAPRIGLRRHRGPLDEFFFLSTTLTEPLLNFQACPWTRCSSTVSSIASTWSQVNGACVVGRTPLMTSSYVEEHVPWYPRVASFTLAERFICRSQYL
ncbi:uncharacterized protein [Aegilops tauschii subsp. strangulata]|uniref:uncharacterized protein isoform X1 n=1 Tax=Aegilops tauschii subsp. strangulata TaxID=200361 RepID=UPI001E1CA862|nr:uncharacterized protein LOC120968346 isoform X1 [Aegilops tauschii subsp. strangulata]